MRWIWKVKSSLVTHRMIREENGQSLILVAGAIVGLIAIIGLGVDLGLVYVERVRLARAMDAAALAAAQELPAEAAAHERALEYLTANGYDRDNACIETLGSTLGEGGGCGDSEVDTIIYIDTLQYRDGGPNTANRIQVRGRQNVPLTFLRVVGFDTAPVSSSATAENIEDLDIVIVYDRSGSMQEDTRCYGCWEPIPGEAYPAGNLYPLPFADPDGVVVHCQASDPVNYEGFWYISIEAEHYSSYLREASYRRDLTYRPKTWWAMQRQPGKRASGPDARGAWMMVGPHSSTSWYYYTLGDIRYPPDPLTTPRLDYDFVVPEDGDYYVWIRAQGGSSAGGTEWGQGRESRRWVHLGLYGTPSTTGSTTNWGPYNDSASAYNWRWTRVMGLPDLVAEPQVYQLNVWAAGAGFRLDKIVITNDPRTNLIDYGRPLGWDRPGVPDSGPEETHGRTNFACMSEDARFTPYSVLEERLDDHYDDEQPIRAAKEAAKTFVLKMDPHLDQVGYVTYSSNSTIDEELYCIKQKSKGIVASCDTFGGVLDKIEATEADGSTNIASALWDGLRVLTTGEEPPNDGVGLPSRNPGQEHYGRPSAAHIMVLMTDGQANWSPSLPSGYGNCYSDNLWPDQADESTDQRRARECVVWFAQHARNQGVVVYTIGLGENADNDLLAYVAEITGGWYYYAPNPDQLDEIFTSLYERIFLRLVD